jgi:hypothetical protein
MPKLYCKHCNQPTDYSNVKPNFCSFCQKPFVSIASFPKVTLEVEGKTAKPLIKQSLARNKIRQADVYEENEEIYTGEPIHSIELELEPINLRRPKETVDGLVFDRGQKINIKREPEVKGKKINKKKVLEEFQQETKSCRYGRQQSSTPIE